MIELSYSQFFALIVVAMIGGCAATLLLAAATGRMGDPDDQDTECQ